jgi:hypothetical protein
VRILINSENKDKELFSSKDYNLEERKMKVSDKKSEGEDLMNVMSPPMRLESFNDSDSNSASNPSVLSNPSIKFGKRIKGSKNSPKSYAEQLQFVK